MLRLATAGINCSCPVQCAEPSGVPSYTTSVFLGSEQTKHVAQLLTYISGTLLKSACQVRIHLLQIRQNLRSTNAPTPRSTTPLVRCNSITGQLLCQNGQGVIELPTSCTKQQAGCLGSPECRTHNQGQNPIFTRCA